MDEQRQPGANPHDENLSQTVKSVYCPQFTCLPMGKTSGGASYARGIRRKPQKNETKIAQPADAATRIVQAA